MNSTGAPILAVVLLSAVVAFVQAIVPLTSPVRPVSVKVMTQGAAAFVVLIGIFQFLLFPYVGFPSEPLGNAFHPPLSVDHRMLSKELSPNCVF